MRMLWQSACGVGRLSKRPYMGNGKPFVGGHWARQHAHISPWGGQLRLVAGHRQTGRWRGLAMLSRSVGYRHNISLLTFGQRILQNGQGYGS